MGSTSLAKPALLMDLQGPWRRVVFVAFFELLAITVSTLGLDAVTDQGTAHAGMMAVATSLIAITWNVTFNWLFERWEARQLVKGRSFKRRVIHALLFELGLVTLFIPMFTWWFQVSWLQAALMQAGLMAFFMIYTFVYNWGFDHLFGLPNSAKAAH